MFSDALEVRDLVHEYGAGDYRVRALRGLDLRVRPGGFTAVMGPSGSGKSTLLRLVAGLDSPTSGRVAVGGQDITGWSQTRLTKFRRTHLGIVFQDFQLIPYLTVEQNVGLPFTLAGRRPQPRLVRAALESVGLADAVRRVPGELSGGQQQRVAIARALITEPALLLADEPTGALDSANARGVLRLLRQTVDQRGRTVLMVTHDPGAAAHADEVVFLMDGQAVGRMQGPTAEAVAGQLAHLDELAANADQGSANGVRA